MPDRPSLVILIGLPGAGKSTFCQRNLSRTHLRINLDMLKTRHRERTIIEACLASRQSMVIDNTNVTVADRCRYIPLAREHGFRVEGFHFLASATWCALMNERRAPSERVPEVAILAKRRRFEPPTIGEGFDALKWVRTNERGDFEVGELETAPTDEAALPAAIRRQITRVAAYGLVVEDQRILLCRLSAQLPDCAGQWTLPGGGIDFGEDPAVAMVREVREETGLDVVSVGLAGIDSLHFEKPDTAHHGIRIMYHAARVGGELRSETDGTTDGCEWFTFPDALRLPLVELARTGLELARQRK